MGIGTTTAILGAAAIGAGASVYAGSQGANAADRATSAQVDANNQALQFQREGRDIAEGELRPYVDDGDAARSMMMSHLGLSGGRTPTTGGTSSRPARRSYTPQFDPQAYLDANPDIARAYASNSQGVQGRFRDPLAFAQWHHDTMGRDEIAQGRRAPLPSTSRQSALGGPVAGKPTPTQTPEQAQEAAWQSYLGTPYARIGRFEADEAKDDFLALAGSQGSALSGRTARGMAEVGEEAAMRNFYGYQGALGGVADTGFSASSGIASAGQTFANNASNTAAATGAAVAQGEANRASAWRSALGDAAGWAGWAAGNINWQPSKTAQKTAFAA